MSTFEQLSVSRWQETQIEPWTAVKTIHLSLNLSNNKCNLFDLYDASVV